MYSGYEEGWQRKKSYLLRSLFHDVIHLSSIPEESYVPLSPPVSPQEPLPPLIIEREPNRHDEPEDYYKVLEIKMKRLYRKLFIEDRDLSDYDTLTDSDIANSGSTTKDVSKDYDLNDVNESKNYLEACCAEINTENEVPIPEQETEDDDTDDNNFTNQESDHYMDEETSPKDSESVDRTTPEEEEHAEEEQTVDSLEDEAGTDFRQITTEALVHVDGIRNADESLVYEDSEQSVILCQAPLKRQGLDSVRVNHERIEDVESMEKNYDPEHQEEHGPNLTNTLEDVEVMRTPHANLSASSIHNTRFSDIAIDIDVTFNGSMTLDIDVSCTTPVSSISKDIESDLEADISNGSDASFDLANCMEYFSGAVSCRKRKLETDASTQTVQKVGWDDIKGNFFIGAPKIFKLCSCTEHVCN